MANYQIRLNKIKEVKDILDELSKIDPNTLARKDDLSKDINFSEAVPHFQNMLDIIKQLSDRDIERLSTNQLDKIFTGCSVLLKLIGEVKGFTLNQNIPGDVCKGIIDRVKNSYDDIMDNMIIPLAFTATQATDYAKIEREAKGYHTNMQEEHGKFMQYIEKVKEDSSRVLQRFKNKQRSLAYQLMQRYL